VIITGASPGETKMWAAVRENSDFWHCGSNNWENVADRWVHAARGLASTELSLNPCSILHDSRWGVSRGNKNVGCGTFKRRFFALAVQITGKLLKIDGYML